MLKAVLCDDEHIVLKGLQKLIVWSQYGVELVATARDGSEALQAIKEHQPDIVLTDIRMPGIDGLELISLIKEVSPHTVCVVFSGYNEYEFVKKAIKLGVIDYLEKPITLDKIREAIVKAVDYISERSEVDALKKQSSKSLLESCTLDLLLQAEGAVAAWQQCYGMIGARAAPAGVTVIVSEQQLQLTLPASYEMIELRHGKEYIHVLLHADEACQQWREQLALIEHVTVGSGMTYSSMAEAAKSYKEALHAFRYGSYIEGHEWVAFESIGDSSEVKLNSSEREEGILFELRLGNKGAFMEKLDQYLEELKVNVADPDVAELELLKLFLRCSDAVKETGGNVADIFPKGFVPQKELRSKATRDEAISWLRQELERIVDWLVGTRQKTKHVAIEKAIQYMEDNYGRDLTQQEVASHVNMNVTYFSLLFKEQMELSYIKYLTKIRIDKAKEMLSEGISVQEISERVGYYHARHFTEVFKKYVGITPGQYRTQLKEKTYEHNVPQIK